MISKIILQGRKTTLEEAVFSCSDAEQVELLSSCEASEEKNVSLGEARASS